MGVNYLRGVKALGLSLFGSVDAQVLVVHSRLQNQTYKLMKMIETLCRLHIIFIDFVLQASARLRFRCGGISLTLQL
jgi:hypothetical protein